MAENIYLSKKVPTLITNIVEGPDASAPGVQTRLKEFNRIISEIRHIDYDDLLKDVTVAEYHEIYVRDYMTMVEANIYERVSQNQNCRFILLHYDFFYNQFFAIVSKYPENSEPGLVVDTIIELIYDYYSQGFPVDFSRDPDRYGAAPIGVFMDQDEILAFFEAVRGLYEGDAGKWLEVVGRYGL